MKLINESEAALRAMKRAADTARERAILYGVPVAIWKDGNVVLLEPELTKAQQDGAEQPATIVDAKSE